MKKNYWLIISFSICGILVFSSCRKDDVDEKIIKLPPVANAGPDKKVALKPISFELNQGNCVTTEDTITLDASLSADPEGTTLKYEWSYMELLSSPFAGMPTILGMYSKNPQVVVNSPGDYWFKLMVTDSNFLSSADSVKITVVSNSIGTQSDILAQPMSTIRYGKKVIRKIIPMAQKTIILHEIDVWEGEIDHPGKLVAYDNISGLETPIPISESRFGMCMVSNGQQVFLGGGELRIGTANDGPTNTVDILDLISGKWTTTQMTRKQTNLTGIATKDKVIFIGGSDTAEIYDISSGTWKIARLSQARYNPTMVEHAGKIYIIGGVKTNSPEATLIDIYDTNTETWTSARIKVARDYYKVAASGSKLYITGWSYIDYLPFTNPIEIWDTKNEQSDYLCLGTNVQLVVASGDNIIFGKTEINSTRLKLYCLATNTRKWTIYNTSIDYSLILYDLLSKPTGSLYVLTEDKETVLFNTWITPAKMVEFRIK